MLQVNFSGLFGMQLNQSRLSHYSLLRVSIGEDYDQLDIDLKLISVASAG